MILATLNATYAGGASVQNATYTVANEVAHPFRISGNELVIPAGESLDYEATQSYTLTISATANGTTATPITVTVNVGNIDDENPVFETNTLPTGVTVRGESTNLSQSIDIDATDGDAPPVGNNNDISYAFVDGSDAIIAPNGLGTFYPWQLCYQCQYRCYHRSVRANVLGHSGRYANAHYPRDRNNGRRYRTDRRRDYYNHRNAPRYICDCRHSQ